MIYKIGNKYIIFIQPPKTGTCTIHSILNKYALIKKNHIPYKIMKELFLDKIIPKNYDKNNIIYIISIREHFNRYKSLYNYIKKKPDEPLLNKMSFEHFVKNIDLFYGNLKFMKNSQNIENQYLSFFNKNYITWMTEDGSEDLNKIVIDNILYLDESYLNNFKIILNKNNINIPINTTEKKNATKYPQNIIDNIDNNNDIIKKYIHIKHKKDYEYFKLFT